MKNGGVSSDLMNSEKPLKRGDLSACGGFRFFAYRSYKNKQGRWGERWIPREEYDSFRAETLGNQRLSEARSYMRKVVNQQKQ